MLAATLSPIIPAQFASGSDPAAVLPADLTLVNGVGTFNVTLLTVGTQTITATDVANAGLTGTMSAMQRRRSPGGLIADYPATIAGVANASVTVRDTIGTIATGYTGTVSLRQF